MIFQIEIIIKSIFPGPAGSERILLNHVIGVVVKATSVIILRCITPGIGITVIQGKDTSEL